MRDWAPLRRSTRFTAGMLAAAALEFMETYNITQLIIVDGASKPIGMLHLHDLVKLGL